MDRGLARRWVEGHRAAERRSLQTLARLPPNVALREALALMALCPDLFATPADGVRLREEAAARTSWKRLRTRLK